MAVRDALGGAPNGPGGDEEIRVLYSSGPVAGLGRS